MTSNLRIGLLLAAALVAAVVAHCAVAQTPPKIGIVIMHGKGGSPARIVADLAAALDEKGYLVANLEMPWSRKREYDVDVSAAVKEAESALAALRGRGAQKLFIAGHSQGGLFTLYLGGRLAVDGVIAMAPGGNVDSRIFHENLGASVANARSLVAEGKGGEKTRFYDFEGSKGSFPVTTTAAVYLSWFDPAGAMNQPLAVKAVNPAVPVLLIVPTGDYPAMLRVKQETFDALPRNPLTRLVEPNASHLNAPSASVAAIVEWTAAVANRQ